MQLEDHQYRLLVESVQDYAIYLLDPTGIVRSWNLGAERLKGYAPAEIIGQSFARFFTEADRASGRPAELLARADAENRVDDIGWRVKKDGTEFWANAVITALRDPQGNLIGFAKVTRDLTDRAYRIFVETTNSIVWSTDGNGTPNADSPSWRAFTGQTEAEWRGKNGWAPVHPEDVGALRVTWPAAKVAGTRFDAEFRLRRHDGVYVWMACRAVPFRQSDGSVREWFGVTFDISDRKLAELERERAIQQLATTLRSIGDAVIATDARGMVTFMNPVAERLTGWTTADASGRSLAEVFPIANEDTGATVENPVDKVLREGVIVGLANHTVLKRRDGTWIPIDDSAAPIRIHEGAIEGVVLVFRDASEEKRELLRRTFLSRASQALIEAADYKDALEKIVQLAVPRLADWAAVDVLEPGETQSRQLALAHVDPAKIEFARELGRRYPPDPHAPTGVPQVIRTGKSELYREIPRDLLEAAARDEDHRRIIRELDLRSALVVPLRGKERVFGAITFIYAQSARFYSDVDLEFAEELARRAALIIERRRLEEEAELANQMKDEFLATISHELRTPLQAILGYATMLERGVARDQGKAIGAILRNASAQARLIEDILDMSRIQSGKLRISMGRVQLATAIGQALDAMRPAAAAKQVKLVEQIAPDIGETEGDFDRLQQIVWNLVSNAVKFSAVGGTVTIAADRVDDKIRVSVRDEGKGIAPEHLSTIFERFRQVDASTTRQHAGLGLGLAIVKYLVEAHGGTVRAESAGPGKGAMFSVELPASAGPVLGASGAPRVPLDASQLKGIYLLIVDDDDDARELIGDALAELGARVERASSAAMAIEQLQKEPPNVLISDIGMPAEDGYSLIRRVRALPPERGGETPAIALTAYARAEDIRKAEEAGFQLHVVKPVRLENLIEAVKSCVRTPPRDTVRTP
ncbi:MAG TPA: PAS domain S-box protein [Kofleriaceae bacterium]|nr:PAS domain S-box protein [Kofleriaceae bacterium]